MEQDEREASTFEEMYEHEQELPVLAGIAACLRWLEELVVLLSGPLLMAGSGIGLVALLSDGQLLVSAPWLVYAWAISKTAIEALRRHRARQASERLRLGAAWPDLDLVFPNRAGRPYHPDDIRRRHLYPLLERAGLPQIRVHDLRHTAATLLLARGVNVKVVSEMLGHANVSVTLSIYSHVLPHMQQHAVDMMDAMLHTPPRRTPDVQGSNQGSAAMR